MSDPKIGCVQHDCDACKRRALASNWTTEAPTVPGWYWLLWHDTGADDQPIVTYVHKVGGRLLFGIGLPVANATGCQWLGPITPE